MKLFLNLIITALFTLSFAISSQCQETPKVAMILTLSGAFASAGNDCKLGIDAALKETGGKVDFIYADSRNEPLTAIKELRGLASQHKLIAACANRSAITMPLNEVSAKMELPLFGAAGHKDFALNNQFAFQLWPKADDEGVIMAREMRNTDISEVSIVYSEDEWTENISENFISEFTRSGGQITFQSSVLPSETDFRSILLRMKSKTTQALYLNLLLPQIAPFIKQAREMSINTQYFSNFYASKPEVTDALGESAKDIKYLEIDTNLPELRKTLGLKPEESPSSLSVSAYVTTYLIVNTLKNIKGDISKHTFYDALLKMNAVETPDKNYSIENRYVRFPMILKSVVSN